MSGTQKIAAERERQIEEEKYNDTHDAQHIHSELIKAAVCYALAVANKGLERHNVIPEVTFWPYTWDKSMFKPDYDDPIRMLVKAGALIAAEIDRLEQMP